MKLTVLQTDLAHTLATASRFVNVRAQLPVLGNILLRAKKNSLFIASTNLEMSLAVSIGAKVEMEGEICVPARQLTELVTTLPGGTFELSALKEQLNISSESFNGSLAAMNTQDFPSVPQTLGEGVLSLDDGLIESLAKTLFSTSLDEGRPVLTGMLLEFTKDGLTLVGTDGFRLSKKKVKFSGSKKDIQTIVPRGALAELVKIAKSEARNPELAVRESDNQVVFGISKFVLATRTIEGKFPDYARIIPNESRVNLSIDKESFATAVKTASIFARDSANVVKIKILGSELSVSSQSSKSGSQSTKIDVKVEGLEETEELEISYNYRFIEEFLNVVAGESVEIGLTDGNSPGMFLDPSDPDFLHLIMPVKV